MKDNIRKLKQEVEAELFGKDSNRDRADANVKDRSQSRQYSELDTDDLAKLSAPIVDRSLDRTLSEKTEKLLINFTRSHFARTQMSPNQGTTGDTRFEGHEHVSYTRDELLQLREMVSISSDILKIKQEVESELVGEDADQDHADVDVARKIKQEVESELFCDDANLGPADVNASVKMDALYLGLSKNAAAPLSDYRRIRHIPGGILEETGKQSHGGPTPTLNKAKQRRSAARRSKNSVLTTVKGILNKPTPEKFDLLKDQLIGSGITSARVLKVSPPISRVPLFGSFLA
ncbi:hypothetical protein CQW23_16416 [Capsicum baccatum]|uniref:Uncharacterized protein n=1 Tax=Capsicum baccatum TaxID=33114 RepID=A0A2G2WAV8_CAPBA|nr:hypothetical protein CQW23_16416 [Capsicum baccatum]